jgi:hypothetical protein
MTGMHDETGNATQARLLEVLGRHVPPTPTWCPSPTARPAWWPRPASASWIKKVSPTSCGTGSAPDQPP